MGYAEGGTFFPPRWRRARDAPSSMQGGARRGGRGGYRGTPRREKELGTNRRRREFLKIWPQNGDCCWAPAFSWPLGRGIPPDFLVSYPGGATSRRDDVCQDPWSAPALPIPNEPWRRTEEPARRPSGRSGLPRGLCEPEQPSPRIHLALIWGKINRSRGSAGRDDNLGCAAGGAVKGLNCGSLRTLKAIGYRATRLLSVATAVTVIHVYRCKEPFQ